MRSTINTVCLIIVASVLALIALYEGKAFFAPILAAFILGIVLTPLSDFWSRLRIPDSIGAFLSALLALAMITVILLLFEPYITKVLNQGPVIKAELRETVEDIRLFFRGIEQMSDDVAEAIEPNSGGGDEQTNKPVPIPSVTDALLYAPQFVGQFLIFSGTLYFFLMARNSVYHWLSETISPLGKSDLRRAATQVSRYVLTITAINFVFGALTALAMQLIGMPSPIVWGLLAFLLNFVLYLGPALLVVLLTVTGIVVFDGAASFLPPALYIAMNATEGQFVTPTLVGKSLSVNPLAVFLSLVFWLWLWGPIGGIIAIPLLIWTMTVMRGMNKDQEPRSDTAVI